MKYYKKIAVAVGTLGLMAVTASCTKSASNSSNAASSAQAYQNPSMSCQVNSGASTLLTVTNLTSSAPGLFTPPQAPVSVSINCANSSAHSPNGVLSGTYSVNGGPATAFKGLSASGLGLTFSTPGANTITITLNDSGGPVTAVTFALPVSCAIGSQGPHGGTVTALSGPSGVNVAAGSSGPGFFNVSLNGAGSGGGGGPYQYAIDINGDNRYDYYTPQNATSVYWNTSGSWQNMYNFYSGSRPINIQTYDTACQFLRTDSFTENWGTLLPAQSSGMGTIPAQPAYSYLQANVSPGAQGNVDPAETVTPFNAQDTTGTRVTCQFSESGPSNAPTGISYTIQATNEYADGVSADQGPLTAQSTLSFQGAYQSGPQTVNLQTVNYQTTASMNGAYTQYSYNMSGSCTAYIQMFNAAPGPCPTGESGIVWGAGAVAGTFSCDGMASTPGGRSLNLDQGYFYCPFAQGSSCVGGGQEGGGSNPSF